MKFRITYIQVVVHFLSLLPIIIILAKYLNEDLSANPIREISIRTGRTAICLLLLSLLCTPLINIFDFSAAMRVRRALGLYAFFYASLHFLDFAILDFGLDFATISALITHQPILIIGLISLLLLIPLAVTSTSAWQLRLGVWWRRLHRLMYVITLLVIVHFFLAVKGDPQLPILFAIFYSILILVRLPFFKSKKIRVEFVSKLNQFLSQTIIKA